MSDVRRRPVYAFDSVQVGDRHGVLRLRVTRAMVRRYWAAMPAELRSRSELPPIAVWDQTPVNLIARRFAHGATVQASTRWHVRRPVGIGELVTCEASVVDKRPGTRLGRVWTRVDATVDGEAVGWMLLEHAVAMP